VTAPIYVTGGGKSGRCFAARCRGKGCRQAAFNDKSPVIADIRRTRPDDQIGADDRVTRRLHIADIRRSPPTLARNVGCFCRAIA